MERWGVVVGSTSEVRESFSLQSDAIARAKELSTAERKGAMVYDLRTPRGLLATNLRKARMVGWMNFNQPWRHSS